MQIDHNPNEQRETNAIWWIIWPIVALNWIGYLWFNSPDWWSIAVGGFTCAVLATWAIEITGNKTPQSWTDAARRTRRR